MMKVGGQTTIVNEAFSSSQRGASSHRENASGVTLTMHVISRKATLNGMWMLAELSINHNSDK